MIYKYALMISFILAGGCCGGKLAAQDFSLQRDGCGCGGGNRLIATDLWLQEGGCGEKMDHHSDMGKGNK